MSQRRLLIIGLVIAALVATACGARLSDEQREAVLSGSGSGQGGLVGGGDPLTGGTGGGGSGTGGGTGGAGGGGQTGSGGGGGGGGGTATGGGGGEEEGGGGGGGGGADQAACAADNGGATDVGVTADRIQLGNVSLLSGPIQGFARTAVGATDAYVNYVNGALRGICGRGLELTVADDRFDSGANRAEHARLADQVFAFVGSLSVVDDGGVSVLRGTSIPDVTLALSDAKLALDNNYSPTPLNLEDGGNNAQSYAEWFKNNEGVTTYAVIWPGQATARNRAQGYRKDYQQAGLTEGYTAEVAVTETNYTPHASQICNLPTDKLILTTALEVNGMARLAKALDQQGCLPKVSHYGAQAYGQQFIDLAGGAAEGVRIVLAFDMMEGTQNPLTQQFVQWFQRTNPSLVPDFFAVQSWVAGHMFATAARAAGADLTRANVIAQLEALKDWTADGMIAPITPGTKTGPRCFLIAKVANGQWTRERPASGFIC